MATLKFLVDARLARRDHWPGRRDASCDQSIDRLCAPSSCHAENWHGRASRGERTVTADRRARRGRRGVLQIATAMRTQAARARPSDCDCWCRRPPRNRSRVHRNAWLPAPEVSPSSPPQLQRSGSSTAPARRRSSSSSSRIVRSLATREQARHAGFLSRWSFPTDYLDHFETPRGVRRHSAAAARGRAARHAARLRPVLLRRRKVAALAALGCRNVINQNRDFYADVAADAVPPHDLLVTNPPYSGDHKQRLLDFLLSRAQQGRPFLLLMPAWVAGTDYWRAFLRKLAKRRRPKAAPVGGASSSGAPASSTWYRARRTRTSTRRRRGTTPPFSTIWFAAAGRATASAARRCAASNRCASRRIEVFRRLRCRRRGHFSQRRHDKS